MAIGLPAYHEERARFDCSDEPHRLLQPAGAQVRFQVGPLRPITDNQQPAVPIASVEIGKSFQ